MSEPRVIKKYPNRRLYDTELSRYITLADLRKLIMDGSDFQVRDAGSGEDLTRTILLQIITDQECGGKPLFTTDILTKMIRFYGDSTQDIFTDYLGQSLEIFAQQQKTYRDQLADLMQGTPAGAISTLARQNFEMWSDVQRRFLGAAGGKAPGPGKKTRK
jgi:polyhydroxyalkanoate synthesis repressor PhaR